MSAAARRHLWRWRKQNGKPLGISTQRSRLSTLKDYFAWLTKQNLLTANPASELELPRQEKRLPVEPLSLEQMKAVLNVPDPTDLLGIRDRAILEVFYSAGLRRGELAKLELTDLNRERQTLQIRQGKGHKDRVVPVGDRALEWLERYLDETRSRLVLDLFEKALFLTSYGEAFNPDVGHQVHQTSRDWAHRLLSSFATHLRHAHAGRRGRHPFHPAAPRTREA